MTEAEYKSIRELLLVRRGMVVLPDGSETSRDQAVRAVELELANLGYVISAKLRLQLGRQSHDQLSEFLAWTTEALRTHLGGQVQHEPLFRRFPEGIPDDTEELWWQKVLVHFIQADDQPCLFCHASGTTHVLNPCRHVVCDRCFDGANYSACPVCEHKVERSSPFFQTLPARGAPQERIRFHRLDWAASTTDEVRHLIVSLCQRTQALPPHDHQALSLVVSALQTEILQWLPQTIPVRENIAIIFGTLLQELAASDVLPFAQRHMTTATDVLRLLAVMSGTDGSLLPEMVIKTVNCSAPPNQYRQLVAKLFGSQAQYTERTTINIPWQVHRFKVVRLPRSVRRMLLAILEGLHADRLVEDMLRHRSYWVWIGEFLHPHEYATRFPGVARAFQIVRKKSKEGIPAPKFRSWYSRLEQSRAQRDLKQFLEVLTERPGEFARRVDLALRLADGDQSKLDLVIRTFACHVTALTTPVLLTLSSLLPTRLFRAKARVYWPKGRVALGVSTDDQRECLPEQATSELVRIIHTELLRRFGEKETFQDALIDDQLQSITVPFNERTASAAAVALPRGSHIPITMEKSIRLFLHWCEPPGEATTDLDLSVALYDSTWKFLGTCSYYALKITTSNDEIVAQSSGDLRNAPWPEGATEFVDLDYGRAASMGVRFAVMVINAYAGLPFSQLERGFAGVMFRDDPAGQHFDPRTVKLKFALHGANGLFMPLVLDFRDGLMHWLDVQSRGLLEMNNVETSKSAIAQICPNLISYFASGIQPTIYQLAILHAAARCQRVTVRGDHIRRYLRRANESTLQFFYRMARIDNPDEMLPSISWDKPIFAALYQGDLDLPSGSSTYTLFREQITPTTTASDLLS